MHPSAMLGGRKFFEIYWRPEFRSILDIGSLDVNGTLRAVAPSGARYIGVDITPGPAVDVVLQDPYSFPFPDEVFDAVVSTSCFEHDELFWLTFLEAVRVLSPRGFLYINAPSRPLYHYPPDRWRFLPDAGPALEKWSRRSGRPIYFVESCILTLADPDFHMERNPHMDAVMIFAKQEGFVPTTYLCDVAMGAEWSRKGSSGPLERRDTPFW